MQNHNIDEHNSESTHILTNLADTYIDDIYFEAAYTYSKSMVTYSEYIKGFIYGIENSQLFWGYLTREEKDILESDYFTEGRQRLRNAHGYPTPIFMTEADEVMDLFSEAILIYCKNETEMDWTIKQYVFKVESSDTLSKDDKSSLLSGFAVMAYSYRYWLDNGVI